MKQSPRAKRLAELVQRELANILLLYYRDNPLIVQATITAVEVAVDLSVARIFICILNADNIKPVLKELQHEGHHLRHMLARSLNLRVTPRLTFAYDYSTVEGLRLSNLIDKAVADDEASHHE